MALGNKGQVTLGQLPQIAMILVTLFVLAGVGAYVVQEVGGQLTGNAANVTTSGVSALETFGDWFSIITIVVVASLVVGLLGFLWMRSR